MREIIFTRRAEEQLDSITLWTYEEFGPLQAEKYQDELIRRCNAIADGLAATQSCSLMMKPGSVTEMRFARSGRHIVVYLQRDLKIIILSLLHSSSDLARQLGQLSISIGET